jgi:putative transposase
MEELYKTYPHNPPHYFLPDATYMVTGAILYNEHLLIKDERKEFFLRTLFERAKLLDWSMEAWAVLNNHYHFIAQAPENAKSLEKLIRQTHSITAIEFNKRDGTSGRQVWHNYWDTCLTYEKSYLARLHYVHENPVKHGLVEDATNYSFCSYKWFIEQGDKAMKDTVFSQPIDKIKVFDNF